MNDNDFRDLIDEAYREAIISAFTSLFNGLVEDEDALWPPKAFQKAVRIAGKARDIAKEALG